MRTNISFLAVLFLIANGPLFADYPLRQSANGDLGSAVAYNSSDHEYLVVWSEMIKIGSFYFVGPIMGQRVSENGDLAGNAFTIFNFGTLSSVAYNSQTN
jgi:hypothetical protein